MLCQLNFYAVNDGNEALQRFEENKGQWNSNVKFKTELINGAVFFENNSITTVFTNLSDVAEKAHHNKDAYDANYRVKHDAYKISFVGSNQNVSITKQGQSAYYRSYFIGNDKSKWTSNVNLFNEITYKNLYDGIDLKYTSNQTNIKYDVIVQANANPYLYQASYEANKKLYIDKKGNLICTNTLGKITEQKPYAYQIINGEKVEVKTRFLIKNNIVSFDFPDGYNAHYDLIIDPLLVASTYSGATSDNWGNTACPGPGGTMRVAGISFGVGYPTTLGAFDTSFNGGWDISVSSFNASGTVLLSSTYIGGGLIDLPYSLITASNGDLLVVGGSTSLDFPVTASAFDPTHNGNRDMVVFRLNPTFTTLVASTYIGGLNDDAYNFTASSDTRYTYSDENRSQIRFDNLGSVIISSSTKSNNFPTTLGSYNPIFNGGLDGVVVKLDANLTTLQFSTFLGGAGNEACTGLQIDALNNLYVCGITTSASFPTTAGVVGPVSFGGSDGFVTILDPTGSTLIASTFLGTTNKDGAMYIDLDVSGNVFVYGLSSGGTYPVTAGAYFNPATTQFIHSLNPTLSTTLFSTVFGSGTNPNISPTAFEVDTCGNIYACGWGRVFDGGTTTGMVTSPGAYRSTTDGADFYFIVLDRAGSTLLYATFFGQVGGTGDHVDGGTSLFDDKGIVYQAVCSSCGGWTTGFPTTPGAYSPTNNSTNCNNAVFKFDLEIVSPPIASFTNSAIGCVGVATTFTNTSTNAILYDWDFGDGTNSTLTSPAHTYSTTGIFTITLISKNHNTCVSLDTTNSIITIFQPTVTVTSATICTGKTTTLTASGGVTYLWDSGAFTSTIITSPTTTQNYTVQAVDANNCYSQPLITTVAVNALPIITVNSPTICPKNSISLSALGALSYTWNTTATTNSITVALFTTDSLFTVQGTDGNGCIGSATSTVSLYTLPVITATASSVVCLGDIITISAAGGNTYLWNTGVSSQSFTTSPSVSTTYTVIGTDLHFCSSSAVVTASVFPLPIAEGNASITAGCPPLCINFTGNSFPVTSTITAWSWDFGTGDLATTQNATYCFNTSGQYTVNVTVIDINGCGSIKTNTLTIDVFPSPTANFSLPASISILEPIVSFTNTSSNFINSFWNFGDYVNPINNSSNLLNPNHSYTEAGTYCIELMVDNSFGCTNTVSYCIEVRPEFAFYIPNCFTPEHADGINDIFTGMGMGISKYEMWIFDRWGEKIFYTNDIQQGWNGKKNNAQNYVQQDVYVWKVKLTDVFGINHSYVGHVTVLR